MIRVEANGVVYEVIAIETKEQMITRLSGRPELQRRVKESELREVLTVKRPRGKKLGAIMFYGNGKYTVSF